MNRWNKVLNPILIKGNWSKEEDELLINWVKENGERGWSKIADKLNGRIGKQCRGKWINCLNPSIRKTEWTDDEDKKIIELHNKFGNKWSKIAAEIQGRSDNQIKNRWNSTLKRRTDCNLGDKNDSKNSDFDWNLSLFMPENNDNIFGGNSLFDDSELFNSGSSLFSCSNDLSAILNDDSWMDKDR